MMTFNRASVYYITVVMYLLFSMVGGTLPNTDMVQGDEGSGCDLILLTEAVFRSDVTEAERYGNILSLYAHSTSQNGDINDGTLSQQDDDINVTLAQWAAEVSLDILKSLESTGVNLNTTATTSFRSTLLHHAVYGNNLRVVKYLVEEKHFDVDAETSFGETPLTIAIQNVERVAIMKYLVDEGKADLNYRDCANQNLLHFAAAVSNLVALKYLIDEKNMSSYLEDRNLVDDTVAMAAVSDGGDLDVLKYLIEEKHVNTNKRNNMDWNLLHIAADCLNLPIVKYLVEEHNFDIMEPMFGRSTSYTWIERSLLSLTGRITQHEEEVLAYLKKRMVDKLKGV